MAARADTDGAILHLWLRLLGWRVVTDRDGDFAVGIAFRWEADGRVLRVGGCARSDGELALQLFEEAMRALERDRHTGKERLAAA
jgi:hypothetical protein